MLPSTAVKWIPLNRMLKRKSMSTETPSASELLMNSLPVSISKISSIGWKESICLSNQYCQFVNGFVNSLLLRSISIATCQVYSGPVGFSLYRRCRWNCKHLSIKRTDTASSSRDCI